MLRPFPPPTCGAYWVLLVGSEWKPSPTPGIVAARLANCRPLSGMLSMRRTSTTPPTAELAVWIMGVSPETLIVSDTVATSSFSGMSIVWPTLTISPLFVSVLKPAISAVRS